LLYTEHGTRSSIPREVRIEGVQQSQRPFARSHLSRYRYRIHAVRSRRWIQRCDGASSDARLPRVRQQRKDLTSCGDGGAGISWNVGRTVRTLKALTSAMCHASYVVHSIARKFVLVRRRISNVWISCLAASLASLYATKNTSSPPSKTCSDNDSCRSLSTFSPGDRVGIALPASKKKRCRRFKINSLVSCWFISQRLTDNSQKRSRSSSVAGASSSQKPKPKPEPKPKKPGATLLSSVTPKLNLEPHFYPNPRKPSSPHPRLMTPMSSSKRRGQLESWPTGSQAVILHAKQNIRKGWLND